MTFKIIKRRFAPEEFRQYVEGIRLPEEGDFIPAFVVVHNTAPPTLAQRKNGFSEQNMDDMRDDYANRLGWHGGPHGFCDDHGIWVFNPLDARGTHSPSWNKVSFGIEMLGDYDTDAFDSGRGAKVRDNAVAAVAILCHKLGCSPDTIKFHKEDRLTDHKDCPGKNVRKTDFVQRVKEYLVPIYRPATPDAPRGSGIGPTAGWEIALDGERICVPYVRDGVAYTPVRGLLKALKKDDGPLRYDALAKTLSYDGRVIPSLTSVRDDNGSVWVAVAPCAAWCGWEAVWAAGSKTITLVYRGPKL